MTTEEKFEEIAEKAIQAAERVSCSFGDFVDGMKAIADQMVERWNSARDEYEAMQDEEGN